MRYFLGMDERKSKITLGAYLPARNPFYILAFTKDCLGEKLGLREGDTILSAGGRTFRAEDDIEDFKLMIETKPGEVVEAVVNRGGKMKSLSMRIPRDVLERYPRVP